MDVDCGQLVGRDLEDRAIVVHLHELAPLGGRATSQRHRRRHEIGEPVEKLKRREVDDDAGPLGRVDIRERPGPTQVAALCRRST